MPYIGPLRWHDCRQRDRQFDRSERDIDRCLVAAADCRDVIERSRADGGTTWSQVATINDSSNPIVDLVCTPTSTTCLAEDWDGNIMRSTDGGGTWTAPEQPFDEPTDGLACVSASACIALDYANQVYTTTDAGANWSAPSTPFDLQRAQVMARLVCATASAFCVATDNDDHIYTTTDGGASWSTASPPISTDGPGDPVEELACPSADLCVATDWDGNLITTTDPGSAAPTWSLSGPVADGNSGDNLTCASSALCLLSDDLGDVLAATATSATAAASPSPPAQSSPTALPKPAPTPASATAKIATASAGIWSTNGTRASGLLRCSGPNGSSCEISVSLSVTEAFKRGKLTAVDARAARPPGITKRTVRSDPLSLRSRPGRL